MDKQTISTIQKSKGNQKLTMITAYDALFAKLFDCEVDFILVGDSLNMSFAGQNDTLSATLDQMIYHTKAVCQGAKNTFIITDIPFGTYYDKKTAIENCIKVFQQTSADAVKIEGGKEKAHIIKYLTSNSISVVGHIGLMPQNFRSEGGYKVKGKDEDNIKKLIKDAKAVEKAGAFLLVVEGVKSEAAKAITDAVSIPVIGIGAGVDTDGQVLVWSDMLGFFEDFKPKFVRQYLDGANAVRSGVQKYVQDVQNKKFPSEEETY
jgi:3-methyl-2-oxobutanoate hydroxymethyltransferase